LKNLGRGIRVKFPKKTKCVVNDDKVEFLEGGPKFSIEARLASAELALSSFSLSTAADQLDVHAKIEIQATHWLWGTILCRGSLSDINFALSKISSPTSVLDPEIF